jgi:hypothetical protein
MTVLKISALMLALLFIAPMVVMEAVVPGLHDNTVKAQTTTPITEGRDSRATVVKNWSVVLSFEYDTTKNDVYDMMGSLQKASQVLYDSTEGQFRFQHADLWTHGKNFNDGNTQIQVHDTGANYRANAVRGGIDISGATINLGRTDFGMLWNNTLGAMTIAHEWSHYGLYLPDQYDDVDMGGYIVSVSWQDGCLMGDNSNVSDSEYCTVDNFNKTNPHAEAKSCWEQIKQHYPSCSMPPTQASIIQNGPYYVANDEMTFTIHFPDLYVLPTDITMSPMSPTPREGDTVTLTAKVHNKDQILVGDVVDVVFYDGPAAEGKIIATKSISLSGSATDTISTDWVVPGGYHNVTVEVDPNNKVLEWEDYTNNTAMKSFHILARPTIASNMAALLKKNLTVDEDQPIILNLHPYESDVESGHDALKWTVTDYDPAHIAQITGTNSVEDVLAFSPVKDTFGMTPVTLTLTDGDHMTSSKLLNLTWTAVNDAPLVGTILLTQDYVYRTDSVLISFNGSDPEDAITSLTPDLELKLSTDTAWNVLSTTFNSGFWTATYSPTKTAKLGFYDLKAKLTDVDLLSGNYYYLNGTLQVLNSPPTITDIILAENIAYRGRPLNITVEGSDAETEGNDLKVDLEYMPYQADSWTHAGSFNYKTGLYSNGKWTIPLIVPATTKVGNCDLRIRLNDTDGPGEWNYLNKTLLVKNSPPIVVSFTADDSMVYRTKTVNLTVEGQDYETAKDKLILTVEYSLEGGDWTSLPLSQAKTTFDEVAKDWKIVYTPAKDLPDGTYQIRAMLRDAENGQGQPTLLTGNLEVKNNPPVAKFTVKTQFKAGDVVSFDAKASSDIEDTTTYLKFEWDFKDGSKATKSRASHSFNKAGKYDVILKVTDRDGGISTAKTSVYVSERPGLGPGSSLGLALLAGIIVAVVVVVLVVLLLVMKKKGKGPFAKKSKK